VTRNSSRETGLFNLNSLVIYPGRESNPGRWDGNPASNQLDHPDSIHYPLKIFNCRVIVAQQYRTQLRIQSKRLNCHFFNPLHQPLTPDKTQLKKGMAFNAPKIVPWPSLKQ